LKKIIQKLPEKKVIPFSKGIMITVSLNDVASITYSIVWKIIFSIFNGLLSATRHWSLLKKKSFYVLDQLANRPEVSELARTLLETRKKYEKCIIFYCSSAGEYEQARPLIDRLVKEPSTMVQVFFHSLSGMKYVSSRPDMSVPHLYFSPSPLTDTVWDWGWIFSVLRPVGTFFIRYEIWPGFLITSYYYSKISLIAGSIAEKENWIQRIYGKIIYRFFDSIYCISQNDCDAFARRYGLDDRSLVNSGDPKYDRVYERAQIFFRNRFDKPLMQRLRKWQEQYPKIRFLIGGSVYLEDISILVKAYQKLPLGMPWVLVLVPHQIDLENIQRLLSECQKYDLTCYVSSQNLENDAPDNPKGCVIIVDQMGFLAEIYALGHAAYVGGANHAQVHNVLEPAIHGLSLSWGDRYHNSREAEILVQCGLAIPISETEKLYKWWCSLDDQTLNLNKARLNEVLNRMLGASERILKHWHPISPTRFVSDT
jgi:3-deoxy-D-manno-octulosonic-acid transferase